MTDQELKDLVASLALDTERMKAEADKRAAETDRIIRELGKQIGGLNNKFGTFTDEAERQTVEADITTAEIRAMQKETAQQIRELGKQIGGLNNKFGSFTEGLALPSVQNLLFERFGVEDFMPRRRRRFQGETIELDALGIVNGSRNEAYIVEIKSHFRSDGVEQLLAIIAKFRAAFPEYTDKKVFGILVAADASADALQASLKAGFYVITFNDDIMRFEDGNGFVPTAY
jgi:hypothetical protein